MSTHTSLGASLLASWCILLAFGNGCGPSSLDAPSRLGTSASSIIGGAPDPGESSAVLIKVKVGSSEGFCSGVLVSPHVVLTAAHCTTATSNTTYTVFTGDDLEAQGSAPEFNIAVLDWYPHPEYDPRYNLNDLGVLITEEAILRPVAALNRRQLDQSFVGAAIRIVGFGQTRPGDDRTIGKRHSADTVIAAVDPLDITLQGTPNFCLFDSGGPSYLEQDGEEVLVGIHYITESSACNAKAYDVRVDRYLDFIDEVIRTIEPAPDAGIDVEGGSTPPDAGTTPPSPLPTTDEEPGEPSSGCTAVPSGLAAGSVAALVALACRRSGGRRRRGSGSRARGAA